MTYTLTAEQLGEIEKFMDHKWNCVIVKHSYQTCDCGFHKALEIIRKVREGKS